MYNMGNKRELVRAALWGLSGSCFVFIACDYWAREGQSGAFFVLMGGFLFLLALVSIPILVRSRAA